MGDADIDGFIAQQKAKLANERQALNDEPGSYNSNNNYGDHERQKWTRYDSSNAPPPAVQQQARDTRAVTPVERGLPLTNRGQEERQMLLAKERRKEYNDFMKKKASKMSGNPSTNPAPVRQGLNIGQYEDERKLLDRERQQDLKNYLDQQRNKAPSKASYNDNQPVYNETRENRGPDPGRLDYQEQRKQLAEERRREYNELLQAKAQTRNPQREQALEQEIDNPSIIPFNRVEQEKMKTRILEEERQREYNETMAKMAERSQKREVTPVQNFDLPTHEQERRLQKEREQREYKAMLDEQQSHQKQMMLLQQGVPYEKVSKMAETQERAVDFPPQRPQRQAFDDRMDRQPFGGPVDNEPDRARAYKKGPQVQFDLDTYTNPSPILAAQSRPRAYDDPIRQNPYNDRQETDSQQPNQRQQQYQAQDQFCGLGFGQYEEQKKTLKEERRKELQDYLWQKNFQTKMNRAEYQQQWRQQHEGPGSGRKQWDTPSDLNMAPRGPMSTDALINQVQRETAKEAYQSQWRQMHRKGEASPRAPANMTGGNFYNSDSFIRDIINEKKGGGETERRKRADADSGLRNINPINPVEPISKEEYRRSWEERNQLNKVSDPRGLGSTVANESKLNIEKTIAAAKQEADDYRKKWEEFHGQGRQTHNLDLIHLPERKHFENFSLHRNNSAYEAQKLRLRQEQKKDLNDFLKKSPALSRLGNQSSPFQTSADYRKRLSDIRNQEYNNLLQKKNMVNGVKNRKWDTPETAAEEEVLPLGRYERTQRHYVDQRKQDFQEHLRKSQQRPIQYYKDDSEEKDKQTQERKQDDEEALPLGGYALIRRKLNEERRREYNEMQAQQSVGDYSPRSQKQSGALLIRDDARRNDRMKKMEADRNREYNEMLAMKRGYPGGQSSLKDQTDEFKAGSMPGNESDNVKWQKRKQRNDEYNEYLANRNQRDLHRFDDKKQAPPPQHSNGVSSLPRLNYSMSAQKRQMEQERNKEYNDMLLQKSQRQRGGGGGGGAPPTNVKTGWGTPDYGDMLAKNRAKEQNFRRANDIAFEADPVARQTEYINLALDRDLEATKTAYKRERIYNIPAKGLLEDPDWLNPWRSPRYPYHNRHYNQWHPYYNRHYDYWEEIKEKPLPVTQYPGQNNGPPSVRRSKDQGGEYFASLPLGRNTDSAQQRQKNQYSNDLKMQMAEAAQARQIERRDGLVVNNNSLVNQPAAMRPAPKHVDPYYAHLKDIHDYDELSPRSNAILGRRQPTSERLKNRGGLNVAITPRGGGDLSNGILDMGLFNQPRTTSLDPPAGLVYQPSTFVTANAIPTMNNSVDEAYNFYATKNPLDLDLNTVPVPAQGGQRNVPSLNLGGVGGDQYGPSSKVRFQEQKGRNTPAQGMEFATDDDRKQGKKQSASEYRAELERQMAEKNMKKQRAKEEKERYELKIEEEAKYYDPFGKGGGGAPMRDASGNVISDLRQIRSDNQNPQSYREKATVRDVPTFTFDKSPRGGGNSYRDDLIGPPPTQTTADGDPSFARGGHGIFGMPKTDGEKVQADKYKLDLKRQIEEKKADDYRKKQLQKLEDEREQKILDEQRAKIQREYEEEQRKTNEKKEEARRKNEELMRAAEEKKRELERQRMEEDERRQDELRENREREVQERQREEEAKRGKSPPIPALRGADNKEEERNEMEPKKSARVTYSPPIAAARKSPELVSHPEPAPYERAQSANVLNQLTRLRVELRKESDRVQTMLHDQEDDVEIYDPRHIQRPPPAPFVSTNKTNVDVFETAVNRNPVALRRTPNERANSRAVEDFNALKHKLDTNSRKQFRELYPGEPLTGDALESQQAALLQQQEDRLRYMKDRRTLEDTSALRVAGRDTHSSSSQLHSNSAFVDVNGIGHFPDDFDDIPQHRNDSARHRRRTRVPSSPQVERITTPDYHSRATFGSQTSLNVDKMARKNEDRLRKLRDLQGDDLSLYDPEDVLDRFMSKQGHNRAPSRNTLLDDTWMRAGSKRSEY